MEKKELTPEIIQELNTNFALDRDEVDNRDYIYAPVAGEMADNWLIETQYSREWLRARIQGSQELLEWKNIWIKEFKAFQHNKNLDQKSTPRCTAYGTTGNIIQTILSVLGGNFANSIKVDDRTKGINPDTLWQEMTARGLTSDSPGSSIESWAYIVDAVKTALALWWIKAFYRISTKIWVPLSLTMCNAIYNVHWIVVGSSKIDWVDCYLDWVVKWISKWWAHCFFTPIWFDLDEIIEWKKPWVIYFRNSYGDRFASQSKNPWYFKVSFEDVDNWILMNDKFVITL